MKLTVVICTYNRSALLMRTIESVNRAAFPPDCELSLLVIPNACTDDTISRLKAYQKGPLEDDILPLHYSEEERPGKSYALNRAIDLIKEGYICFIDDDHRLDEAYFVSVRDAIVKYTHANIFCGRVIPDWTGDEPGWVHAQGKYRIYPLPVPDFLLGEEPLQVSRETRLPGGGNLVVHRKTFDRTGSFSTELGPTGHNLLGSEDSDFVLRALSKGEPIQYVPEIIQYHYVDNDRLRLGYLLKKSFQRTRSITLASKPEKHPVPRYLWRKLLNYSVGTLFSFNLKRIRFYLVRFSSTLGEVVGTIETVRHPQSSSDH